MAPKTEGTLVEVDLVSAFVAMPVKAGEARQHVSAQPGVPVRQQPGRGNQARGIAKLQQKADIERRCPGTGRQRRLESANRCVPMPD
jgi:hypothetical protein